MIVVVPRNNLQHIFGATIFLFGPNSIGFDVVYRARLRRGKSKKYIGRDVDVKEVTRIDEKLDRHHIHLIPECTL